MSAILKRSFWRTVSALALCLSLLSCAIEHPLLSKQGRATDAEITAELAGATTVSALPANQLLNSKYAPTNPLLGVKVYNVGQGNCILVRFTNGHYALVDCGSTSSGVSPTTIAGLVDADAGGTIQTVVLTHPDADHVNIVPYINSAKNATYILISQQPGDYTAISGWLTTYAAKVTTFGANYMDTNPSPLFDSGATKVYILAANVSGDYNTGSIVLSIDANNASVLLTGDATQQTEKWIAARWDIGAIAANMLVPGHHGSNHSSSFSFLKAVANGVAVFSASASHTGYGHPRCSVYDLLKPVLDQNNTNGFTITQHNFKCWDDAKGQFTNKKLTDGAFLTATQGNIVFQTDKNANYGLWADTP